MIQIATSQSKMIIQLTFMPPAVFNAVVVELKSLKFRYDPDTKQWSRQAVGWESVVSRLEEIDVVEYSAENLLSATCHNRELVISESRVIPDYSLLLHPPMIGKAPFEDYQKRDIQSGLQRNRYGYFLGMGSGKSFIAAALIAHIYGKWKKASKVVFITSNIGVRNIIWELEKFIKDFPSNRVAIADKNNRAPFTEDVDIVVTSYHGFRLVAESYKKKAKISSSNPRKPFIPLKEWFGKGEGILLLDESHNAANPKSKQGSYIALHAPAFEYRYLFTGTPADKPEKLYNQFKILDPALVQGLGYTDWLSQYANMGNRFSMYAVNSWRYEELEKLNKQFTAEYGIYRNSVDIIQLPEHYVKHINVEMSTHHRNIYEEFIQSSLEDTIQRGRSALRDLMNLFPYMMLAVENPFLLKKHADKLPTKLVQQIEKLNVDHLEKMAVVADIIEEHVDEQGILWVSHPHTAELLREKFAKLNPIVIVGSTEKEEREKLLSQFKTTKSCRILIASIHVLNTSVTLTNCTWQCYVERVWSYSAYEQSQFRIYRIGQELPVVTYIPIYRRSLDVLLDKNLSGKGKLVQGLMSKDFLTQDEWTNIFNMEAD